MFSYFLQDFEVFRSIDPREYIYDLWKFSPEFKENLTKFSEVNIFLKNKFYSYTI